MTLIVKKIPTQYNESRSPVLCNVETDNYIVNGNFGDPAIATFSIPPGPVAGNYIKIVSTAITIQLDFIAWSSTPTVGKIRVKNTGMSLPAFFAQVLSDIQLNSALASAYTITSDGFGGYAFVANVGGANYDLSGSSVSGAGFYLYINQVGMDDIQNGPRENYKIGLRVEIEPVIGNPGLITIYDGHADPVDNKVEFNIAQVLDPYLSYFFPDPNQNVAFACAELIKGWSCKVYEVYGNPPVDQGAVVQDSLGNVFALGNMPRGYILKAGHSISMLRNFPSLQKNQLSGIFWASPRRFLTNQPRVKKFKYTQNEYLFFSMPPLSPPNVYGDVWLAQKYYFPNGSTDIELFYTVNNPVFGQVICFPVVGYFTPNTHNTAIKVESWVTLDDNNFTPYSEVFTHVLDTDDSKDEIVVLFTQGLGGVDTCRFTGVYRRYSETSQDISSRYLKEDDPLHLGDSVVSNIRTTISYDLFSGWLSKSDISWLAELDQSEFKVILAANGSQYVPVTIKSQKLVQHDTDLNLYRWEMVAEVSDHTNAKYI